MYLVSVDPMDRSMELRKNIPKNRFIYKIDLALKIVLKAVCLT